MKCAYCGNENETANKFCMYCGKPLAIVEEPAEPVEQDERSVEEPVLDEAAEGGESFRIGPPPEDSSEPQSATTETFARPAPPPVEAAPAPRVAPPPQERAKPGKRERRLPAGPAGVKVKRPPAVLVAVGGGVLFLAIFAALAVFVFPGLFRGDGPQVLYFAIQEEGQGTGFTSVMQMKGNGTAPKEIASERDGLRPATRVVGLRNSAFSPDLHHFAMHEADSGRDLLLFSMDGSIPEPMNDGAIDYARFQGFSPSGKYFAYSCYTDSRDEFATFIVDMEGSEVAEFESLAFSGFLNDNRVLLIEFDPGDSVPLSIGIGEVRNDDYNPLVSLNEDPEDGYLYDPNPFLSPDGKRVYYIGDDSRLYAISTSGGEPEEVYKFDSARSIAFFSPSGKNIVLMDMDDSNTSADLLLLNPASKKVTRIDRDLGISNYNNSSTRNAYGEDMIVFSPNERYIAYVAQESGGLDLYVAQTNGEQAKRVSSDARWYSFSFSPDGKRLVYIEGEQTNDGGDLYTLELAKSKRSRLDTNVWSYSFSNKSNYLLYYVVDGLDGRSPESQLMKIRIDGKNKQRLVDYQDGLFSFLNVR
jgi:hypothetical protein